jgi:soluble cytochrome b562
VVISKSLVIKGVILKPIKKINIKTAISKIKYIGDDKFCIVDEENNLRIYSLKDYKLLGGFRIKLPKNRPLENGVDISNSGKYLAIAITGKKKTSVWDIENKKQLFLLGWHRGDVLSVSFDKEEKYLLTGGEDGRSYLWSMTTGKMVSALPPQADYVISNDFSLNSLWAATGCYDRSVTITNITSMDISFKKKSHKGSVTKLKFILNQKLISGDKTGELIIWDYTKGSVFKRLTPLSDRIVDLCVDKNNRYMVVISTLKKVFLYSLESYEIVSDEFIKLLASPSALEFVDDRNYLIVGTLEGDIYIYDLLADERELRALIANKKFAEAYALLSSNPFLKSTKAYVLLENKWNKILNKAQKLLENSDIKSAKEILKPFMNVPTKRGIIQNLLSDFKEFEKFKNAVLNLKYLLAYSLANQYPSFKETIYYKKMEDDWKKLFKLAKEAILKENDLEKAKEYLKPFRGVPSKTPLIQALFNEKQLYDLLKEKLAKRDFKEFFMLIKRYPFLSETEEYEKAINFAKVLNENIKVLLKKGEYKKALFYAQMLKDFPGYEDKAKEYEEKAKILMEFQRLIAQRNYQLIFDYVKKYPFLEEVDDYKILFKEIQNRIIEAEKYAAKGDVEGILKTLEDLVDVREYYLRILNLIKSAYYHQIIFLLTRKLKGEKVDELIKKGIKNYVNLFGVDLEIKDLIEKAKKLKVSVEIKEEIDEENHLPNINLNKLPIKIYE